MAVVRGGWESRGAGGVRGSGDERGIRRGRVWCDGRRGSA